MDRTIDVADVRTFQTKAGNTRFVVRDAERNEYTTFREEIGTAALAARGRKARIEFHEQERGSFRNVYLDAIEPLEEQTETDEGAWRTAVEAAPWLLASTPPEGEVPPAELFDKLKPFKELVAEDIKDGDES